VAPPSSRVDIAPRRPRDLPPANRKRLDAAVDADRSRLVGHYVLSRAQHGPPERYGRGRAAKSNQGWRPSDGAVISSTRAVIPSPPPCVSAYIAPVDYRITTTPRHGDSSTQRDIPCHKSAQASLGLLCRQCLSARSICNVNRTLD